MPTVLSIQSQVSAARVGNSVAVFAMERLGVEVLALPTVLFGRRPDRGPPGGGPVPAEQLAAMLEALEADGALARVDAVLSGYLGAPEQAEIVLDAVARTRRHNPHALYVCDPVLGDWDRGLYAKPAVAEAMRDRLVPAADLITPNAFELSWLAGRSVRTLSDAAALARDSARAMLITSLALGQHLATLLCTPELFVQVETPELAGSPKGAGDLLTALYLARRLLGQEEAEALLLAVGSVFDLIAASGGQDLPIITRQDLLLAPETKPAQQRFRP